MRRIVSILALGLAVVGVTATHVRAQTPSLTRAAYDSTMRRFVALLKRGTDISAILSYYAPNATWVDSDGSVNVGHAQLERLLRGYYDALTIKDYSIETTTFHSDGPTGYVAGIEHLQAVDKKTGKPVTMSARFLAIMRARPDGRPIWEYGLEAPIPEKAGTP